MKRNSSTFGVETHNIPYINLRYEFQTHLELLRKPSFRELFTGRSQEPIRTPYLIWLTMPESLLTLMLQRAITGLESWVVGAVFYELGLRGRLDKGVIKLVHNPGSLPGRSMARKYYNSLPALVDESFSLEKSDPKLWERTVIFYREVRNPIMHGREVNARSVDGVLTCFEHMMALYKWNDLWHDPQSKLRLR